MAFSRKIKLLQIKQGYGSTSQEEILAEGIVWCDVKEVGSKVAFSAMSAGVTLEKTVVMWREEFKDYNYVEWIENKNTVRFKVVKTAMADNPLHIKLLLSRG